MNLGPSRLLRTVSCGGWWSGRGLWAILFVLWVNILRSQQDHRRLPEEGSWTRNSRTSCLYWPQKCQPSGLTLFLDDRGTELLVQVWSLSLKAFRPTACPNSTARVFSICSFNIIFWPFVPWSSYTKIPSWCLPAGMWQRSLSRDPSKLEHWGGRKISESIFLMPWLCCNFAMNHWDLCGNLLVL